LIPKQPHQLIPLFYLMVTEERGQQAPQFVLPAAATFFPLIALITV
jgi:hypothetical protein